MSKEKWAYLTCFILGMMLMYYFMQARTECMVKFVNSKGETHVLVGVTQ